MISVSEALRTVLSDLPHLEGEMLAVPAALGRIVAETVHSPRDVPPFRNSAMDGFAVRAADVAQASAQRPITLRVLETIGAGAVARHELRAGEAIRIMTGAPVPASADAVVRVEDTIPGEATVAVTAGVPVGANVREAGEDVRRGDAVLVQGHRLRPADIGLLVSIGSSVVRVARRPRVSIITTGDELVELGQPLGPGQIVNSNAYTLAAALEELGAVASVIGIVPDRPGCLRDAFTNGLQADVMLTTGGVSVGNFDFVRSTLADLGYRELFWKVAQKPGKPLSFGYCGRTPIFGLPGNPVSALVCFYVYVAPSLRTMMRQGEPHLAVLRAELTEEIRSAETLTEFVRCTLDGPLDALRVRSTGTQSSGVLRSLSLGDGLIVVPAGVAQIEAGSTVSVLWLRADVGRAESPL